MYDLKIKSEYIKPLSMAEHRCLQVLLTSFTMRRTDNGNILNAYIDKDTPAIWTNQAKAEIREKVGDFNVLAEKYQKKLDHYLIDGKGLVFEHKDERFPFRYISGGMLPIVRLGGEEFYCLTYRPIFPIGWNIANGHADTVDELMNPLIITEREFREELIILDVPHKKRYVLDGCEDQYVDRPEFAKARKLWLQRLPELDLRQFEETLLPIKYLEGPDSVKVTFGDSETSITTGVFLNINGRDFGIEVDRVAKMGIPRDAVICFGDIKGNQIIDAPVGLFSVSSLDREKVENANEFIPEKFFYKGRLHSDGSEVTKIIEDDFIPYLDPVRSRSERHDWDRAVNKFALCPVTKRILQRYLPEKPAQTDVITPSNGYDIFICFASEDKAVARSVYDFFTNKEKKVFFSEESKKTAFSEAIDEALESASCLIVTATDPEHLRKKWVSFEYSRFRDEILADVKPDGVLLSFISGFEHKQLPFCLRGYKAVEFSPHNMETALNRLAKFVEPAGAV